MGPVRVVIPNTGLEQAWKTVQAEHDERGLQVEALHARVREIEGKNTELRNQALSLNVFHRRAASLARCFVRISGGVLQRRFGTKAALPLRHEWELRLRELDQVLETLPDEIRNADQLHDLCVQALRAPDEDAVEDLDRFWFGEFKVALQRQASTNDASEPAP